MVAGTQVPGKRAFVLLSNAHFPFLEWSDPNCIPDSYPHHLLPPDTQHSRGTSHGFMPLCLCTGCAQCLGRPPPVLHVTNSFLLWRPSLRRHLSFDLALELKAQFSVPRAFSSWVYYSIYLMESQLFDSVPSSTQLPGSPGCSVLYCCPIKM